MSRQPKTVADYAALAPDAKVGLDPVLKYAIMNKAPLAAIRDLLQRGATIGTLGPYSGLPGGSLLHFVAWWGYRPNRDAGQDWTARDLIRMLVQEFGMDPNARDARGHAPLWHAIRSAVGSDNAVKGLYELGADVEDPDLDTLTGPQDKAMVKKIRTFRRARTAMQKEHVIKEAATQQAEQTPLNAPGEEPRMMTGIPPGVPGPSIVKQFLPKGGRKSKKVRRHRKSTRRHRKSRI